MPRGHSYNIYLCIAETQERLLGVEFLGYFKLERHCQITHQKPGTNLPSHQV